MGMPANASSEKQPSQSDGDSGTHGRQPGLLAPRRGRLFQVLWPVTSYLVTNVTVTLFWVREGRRDLHALHRMIQVLPHGVMTLFPEGTRSRDGSVGPGRAGAGLLILATRAQVIPVAIDGMQEVLPVGCHVPRIFKRIYVSCGPPVDYAEFLALPRTRETAQALIDRVMEAMQRSEE